MAKKRAKVGPKSKLTPQTRQKLEEAAALDASVGEMCYYADISRDTYYRWMKENPELSDRIEKLRERPILAARQAVVNKATESYSNAMDYLSRKRKNEFSQRHENTGADGGPIQVKGIDITFRED